MHSPNKTTWFAVSATLGLGALCSIAVAGAVWLRPIDANSNLDNAEKAQDLAGPLAKKERRAKTGSQAKRRRSSKGKTDKLSVSNASLEQNFVDQQQAQGGASYHAKTDPQKGVFVQNPSAHLRAEFTDGATTLIGYGGQQSPVTMRLSRVGCSQSSTRLALSERTVQTENHKVTRDWGPVKEWYSNGPLGLEQGFTVEKKSGLRGRGGSTGGGFVFARTCGQLGCRAGASFFQGNGRRCS